MTVQHKLHKLLFAIVGAAALCSCSLMSDDQSDCPTGLYVNFVYDYNTQRADMFKDHVGAVTLSVYDEQDRLVAQRAVSGSQLSDYGYAIHFSEQELAPDHQYRLVALALQRDWQEAWQTGGSKYRVSGFAAGDSWPSLRVTLDAQAAGSHYAVVAPLDTLWHTLTTLENAVPLQPAATRYHLLADGTVNTNGVERIALKSGEPSYATVSLIRDTKHLNVSLREIDHPEHVDADDYELFIVDNNRTLDHQNNLVDRQDTLVYRPYAQWTTTYASVPDAVERSAHYDLMFNRLVYSPTPAEGAVLCIRRKSTGQDVAVLNLAEVLAQGRTAYEINNYSPQEYLDREYDYRLELFLKGEEWQQLAYLCVCIDVLSWAKRIQYIDF